MTIDMDGDPDNDWHPLGAIFLRKWSAYKYDPTSNNSSSKNGSILNPSINFDDFIVCGAPYGGPIAFVTLPKANQNSPQRLYICSPAGKQFADVKLTSDSINNSKSQSSRLVVGIGWTESEHVAIVMDDGLICSDI